MGRGTGSCRRAQPGTFHAGFPTRSRESLHYGRGQQLRSLDFGYSQSKWVAEQVVADARSRGLSTRVFRPALVSPSITGGGNNFDIAISAIASPNGSRNR